MFVQVYTSIGVLSFTHGEEVESLGGDKLLGSTTIDGPPLQKCLPLQKTFLAT
jgi:hypothetical protein